jgi:hypothetical protein
MMNTVGASFRLYAGAPIFSRKYDSMPYNIGSQIDITVYEPTPFDKKMYNPMLAEVWELISRFGGRGSEKARTFLSFERDSLTGQYAFSIPTAETLQTIAIYSPIVEIGAGSGYWAMCLAACGVDIIAYDRYPPGEASITDISERNWHFRKTWYRVNKGDELAVAAHSNRALFLCWPPPENPMGVRALDAYIKSGGRTVIVIGEMRPLSMGDANLYELLNSLTLIERRRIHGWPGFSEEILVCSCR